MLNDQFKYDAVTVYVCKEDGKEYFETRFPDFCGQICSVGATPFESLAAGYRDVQAFMLDMVQNGDTPPPPGMYKELLNTFGPKPVV